MSLEGLNVHVQVPTYGIKPHHAIGPVANRVRFLTSVSVIVTFQKERCVLRTEIFFMSFDRLEAYFHTCDELLHMWAHAEDLDTLEFALMQVTAYIAGPVRAFPPLSSFVPVWLIQARSSRMCPPI
jgi:hypothetical protein